MHPILKENEYILKETNLDVWHENFYTGKNIHVVIFDKKASPHDFLKSQVIAPFCPNTIISHGTNVTSVIAQFSECKITMLTNTNECREYFKKIADTVDIINISMSADKTLAEHNWGFLEQYDIPVFCSSGNDGDNEINYPSAFPWIISVGAFSKGRIANYSNYSDLLDCVGHTDLYIWNSDKQSFKFNGTSCSSPQVVSAFTSYAQFIKDNYNKKITRQEAFDFVHKNCIATKEDEKDGYGLFCLPKVIPIIQQTIETSEPKQTQQQEIIINPPSSPSNTSPTQTENNNPQTENNNQGDENKIMSNLVSSQCVDFVKSFEGFSAVPYFDCVGVKTIGYGMTGSEIEGLNYVTEEQATEMLKNWLNNNYAKPIKDDLDSKGVNLNQNQFDALVSMAYNIGVNGLLGSTLYKNVCAGVRDVDTITENFTAWCHAGGKVVEGLLRRRQSEANMFFGSGNENKMEGEVKVKNVIVYYSSDDYSVALIVANALGGIAMFNRNRNKTVHSDAMGAENVYTIGGPKLGHPNEIYWSGNTAADTAQAVLDGLKSI